MLKRGICKPTKEPGVHLARRTAASDIDIQLICKTGAAEELPGQLSLVVVVQLQEDTKYMKEFIKPTAARQDVRPLFLWLNWTRRLPRSQPLLRFCTTVVSFMVHLLEATIMKLNT